MAGTTQGRDSQFNAGPIVQNILTRLTFSRQEKDGWLCHCPAHDDNSASLRVTEGGDGRALITCRAGCSIDSILAAIHLDRRDMFRPKGSGEERALPEARGQGRPPFGKILKTYDYIDENGAIVFQVVRDEHKNFRQRRPAPGADPGETQWSYDLSGVRRVLYHLDIVTPARRYGQRIYIVEGEKGADAMMESLGVVATAASQGAAAAWLPQYTDQLAGAKDVVIIPDNDEPGRKHAEKIRDAIADWVDSVKVLSLPDLPDKGDVFDWIQAGGTKGQLEDLAAAAPPWITAERRFTAISLSLDEFLSRNYPKPRSLLGDGLICAGDLVFLYGQPGLGKTWMILQILLELSQGNAPFGLAAPEGGPVRVGLLELELGGFFLKQRASWILEKSPTNSPRKPIRIIARPELKGAVDMMTEDYKALERWCRDEVLDLVVIDALNRVHSVDENKAVEFSPVLRRFDEISETTSTAILVVHHEPKMPRDGKDLDDMAALRGTTRMTNDSKALMRLVDLKKDELFCLRFPKTNNAAPIKPIYLTRPKNSGFEVTSAPQDVKDKNLEMIAEALLAAGRRGVTPRELEEKSGLSKQTVFRHLDTLRAVQKGEPYTVTDRGGRAKVHLRWVSESTESQRSLETQTTIESAVV